MTPTYVRFVAGDTRIFQAAGELSERGDLSAGDRAALEELCQWFMDNLEAPDRFVRTRSKAFYRKEPVAICWFKDDAAECIAKAWALARILERNGVGVDFVRTTAPGYVTYEDEHQVAAIPFADR